LRVGGIWRQHMVIDESTAYVTGVYREIVNGANQATRDFAVMLRHSIVVM
jgi:hypothetical protein